MTRIYYQEQALENIARQVLCSYDSELYYGTPTAIPIEEIIESHGVSLEYQYLRKNGHILGKTIFDKGLETVYDMEIHKYILFPVNAGTILVDASLCEEDSSRLCRHLPWGLVVVPQRKVPASGSSSSAKLSTRLPPLRVTVLR